MEDAKPFLKAYAQRIRDLVRANADVPETGLAPAFHELLTNLLTLFPFDQQLTVVPEYNRAGVGRPDIALIREGEPPRAFVELKAPAKPADPQRWRQHDKRQFERFSELAAWATCNFVELRLLQRGNQVGQAAIVPEAALRPNQSDANADTIIDAVDCSPLMGLVEQLCRMAAHQPAAANAKELATLMAHSARLVRGIVQEKLAELNEANNTRHALWQVRQEFRDVLYAHPEAGGYNARDFDTLFSAAFAQTLAFGLLLVKESTNEAVDYQSWRHMPEEHPLMRTALRVLSQDEVVDDIGIGFEVLCDTVNCFTPEILAIGEDGHDPILYFYEDFLETFDPEAREKYGVYYTPLPVVRYMSAALDRALRENLNTGGLSDPNVQILDPATGTGTFLLGLAERVRRSEGGGAMANLALRNLAGRMYGLELLVGPYAVAHYRLHHTLSGEPDEDADAAALELPRLGVYLADTLAEPGAAAPVGQLGFVADGIRDERHRANEIKTSEPILAIIGNPPYRRLEEGENRTLVGRWMDGLWDDLKKPVRDADKGGQLNTFPELSVAFWRWAIWKLFEAENAPRRGVIAFITNRKFLTGWPYAGLRKMMRERFDRIEIIDLRGDIRRGERAGVEHDTGVFNIQVGTCITLAIADGSKSQGALAQVLYHDSWEHERFSKRAKLDWLEAESETGGTPDHVVVDRGLLDDFRPIPFLNGQLVGLDGCFEFYVSGIQTKRDSFVYASSNELLSVRIRDFITGNRASVVDAFAPTGAKSAEAAQMHPFDQQLVQQIAYRVLDTRWLYNHEAYIDRRRPELQAAWGNDNVCLYAMPGGTGAGPAVWCHGLLPDYHSFRGRGGYAFPLWDRRRGTNAHNLNPDLLLGLNAAYGVDVEPQSVFDAMLCLMSANSYTLRFAEDLEDVFPHVPFPASHETFLEAAALGAQIRAVETFARAPGAAFLPAHLCRIETEPQGNLAEVDYADGSITLCEDGSGYVSGIPQEVWEFAVSGYRVLPRWLAGRVGREVNYILVRELRDICGRIAELLALFDQADILLESTLQETLTREALNVDA